MGIQLCVDVQLPLCYSGADGEAVYIDTEGVLEAMIIWFFSFYDDIFTLKWEWYRMSDMWHLVEVISDSK